MHSIKPDNYNKIIFINELIDANNRQGNFGAVLGRAGVGKTPFVVQLGLGFMMKGSNVLHISLNDSVDKVSLWYREICHKLAMMNDSKTENENWESLLPHRFIMTFKTDQFSLDLIEDKILDLIEKNIFHPGMIIIDGLSFQNPVENFLNGFKTFLTNNSMHAWFTMRAHRHLDTDNDTSPEYLLQVEDMFDTLLKIQPEGKTLNIKYLKGSVDRNLFENFIIEPGTMLVKPVSNG